MVSEALVVELEERIEPAEDVAGSNFLDKVKCKKYGSPATVQQSPTEQSIFIAGRAGSVVSMPQAIIHMGCGKHHPGKLLLIDMHALTYTFVVVTSSR